MKDDMRIDDGFASKVIVFVDDRKLTTMIRDWLNSLGKKYRAERFVSSQVTSDKDGIGLFANCYCVLHSSFSTQGIILFKPLF